MSVLIDSLPTAPASPPLMLADILRVILGKGRFVEREKVVGRGSKRRAGRDTLLWY